MTAVADWSDSDGKAGSGHEAEEESEAGSSSSRDGLYCRDTGQRAPMCDVRMPACGVSVHHHQATTSQPDTGGNPTAARQSDTSVVASSASPPPSVRSPPAAVCSPPTPVRSPPVGHPQRQSVCGRARRTTEPSRAEPSGARRRRH